MNIGDTVKLIIDAKGSSCDKCQDLPFEVVGMEGDYAQVVCERTHACGFVRKYRAQSGNCAWSLGSLKVVDPEERMESWEIDL